ncbi:hypothetical protein BDK51DRAFT_51456 [Blyttiomyces helicus]|uniref:Uncharacterized protein n=1 Tax=Blyttiomyces helicus TaxID=388810 RepID=A0A4P9WLN0_9FUNG|nr:hypothetical protein BDK51DRAFT_51456 [Blyttiomyces helicus]|eukprot:RKO93085.1 hypothetical protein BDK51DRAFT_51456 [Blyttiomyces helicus]
MPTLARCDGRGSLPRVLRFFHKNVGPLTYAIWQLATLGGYCQLWSHRSYKAALPLRVTLAVMGAMAYQGSIRWWTLRRMLHHRDSKRSSGEIQGPISNNHSSSFMAWLLAFAHRMNLRIHVLPEDEARGPSGSPRGPWLVAAAWGGALGGLHYGGLLSHIPIWHVSWGANSVAHWLGDQPLSVKHSAREIFLMALLTNGDGNHNEVSLAFGHAPRVPKRLPQRHQSNFIRPPQMAQLHVLLTLTRALPDPHPRGQDSKGEGTGRVAEMDGRRDPALVLGGGLPPDGYLRVRGGLSPDATPGFYGLLNSHSQAARAKLRTLQVVSLVPETALFGEIGHTRNGIAPKGSGGS